MWGSTTDQRLVSARFIALCAVSLGVGCRSSGPGIAAPAPEPPPNYERLSNALGTGDVVEIRVFREPELGGTYRLGPEGKIDFPFIGVVELSGKTEAEVSREIQKRLADGYLQDPQVTVFVREFNSRKVHVLGQVTKPGTFGYDAGMTIIQAITNAGGFTRLASPNNVRVTREQKGAEKNFVVRVGDIREGTRQNFLLLPGDIIYVPQSVF